MRFQNCNAVSFLNCLVNNYRVWVYGAVRYITILRDIEQDVEGPQTGPEGIGVGAMN